MGLTFNQFHVVRGAAGVVNDCYTDLKLLVDPGAGVIYQSFLSVQCHHYKIVKIMIAIHIITLST